MMNLDKTKTVTIERSLDAPLDLVWEAWTSAEHIVKWWSPAHAQMQIEEHSFEVGGHWKYTMPMPDGSPFVSEGTYLVIEPKTKIVTTASFKPMTEGIELHMLFEAQGDKTKFTFHVVHPTEAYKLQQEKMGIYNGWGSAFDRLDSFLKS